MMPWGVTTTRRGRPARGAALLAAIYGQFRRPQGLGGRLAGWIMAHRPSNIERNRWTVGLLDVREADHVLEIGFGPGLAIERVARLATKGRVVGIDHSAVMVEQARRRNRTAIAAGLVELQFGGLELLPRVGEVFDKVYLVNVPLLYSDQSPALHQLRSVLKPGGVLAVTHQPRRLGATAKDAQAFGDWLSTRMSEAGFRRVSVAQLELKPVPAVCVMGRK